MSVIRSECSVGKSLWHFFRDFLGDCYREFLGDFLRVMIQYSITKPLVNFWWFKHACAGRWRLTARLVKISLPLGVLNAGFRLSYGFLGFGDASLGIGASGGCPGWHVFSRNRRVPPGVNVRL